MKTNVRTGFEVPEIRRDILDNLFYCSDYIDCQDTVSRAYRAPEHWTTMSILNAARGNFRPIARFASIAATSGIVRYHKENQPRINAG